MKTFELVRSRSRWLAMFAALALSGAAVWPERPRSVVAQDQSPLAKFMRKKLDTSSLILEGLTTEDMAKIKEGTKSLLEMSKSEMWNVLVDEDYREFNRDFRSSIRKLEQAAKDENLDNALLQWNDAVKGCVECHKYVRSERAKVKK